MTTIHGYCDVICFAGKEQFEKCIGTFFADASLKDVFNLADSFRDEFDTSLQFTLGSNTIWVGLSEGEFKMEHAAFVSGWLANK